MIQTAARLFGFLIFGLFFLSSLSTAWGVELSIPDIQAKPGETITVPLTLDQADNLAGVKLAMTYDPKVLQYKGGNKTSHTAPLMHIVNDKKPGRLILVMAGAAGIKGEKFPIFTLTFEVVQKTQADRTQIQIHEIQLMSDALKELKATVKLPPIRITH